MSFTFVKLTHNLFERKCRLVGHQEVKCQHLFIQTGKNYQITTQKSLSFFVKLERTREVGSSLVIMHNCLGAAQGYPGNTGQAQRRILLTVSTIQLTEEFEFPAKTVFANNLMIIDLRLGF